jgi:hypothetical protein
MAFDVLIGGLDTERARALEAKVRRTVVDLRATDVVTVAVLPSDATNRWDVGVRRSAGWSVTWFDSGIDELAARVASALRDSFDDAAVARRQHPLV